MARKSTIGATTETRATGLRAFDADAKPVSPGTLMDLLRLFDLSVIGLMGLGIYLVYVSPNFLQLNSRYVAALLVAMFLGAILFQRFGLYDPDSVISGRLRVGRLLAAWATIFGLLLTAVFALKISDFYSRVWAVSWFAATAWVLLLGRLGLAWLTLRWAREGRFASRTVILGAGALGQRLAAHLREHNDLSIGIIGFVDDRATRVPKGGQGYELLGDTEHLIALIRQGVVDQVLIALPWSADARLSELIYRLAMTPVRIRLAPDLAGFEFAARSFTQVAQLPMLQILDRPISGWAQLCKTVEDRVLAALFLLILGPLMLLIAAAVKLDSAGPVFFRQQRHGFNNSLIEVWKYRSMYVDMADADCETQTTKGDPRITRVGRFLRKSSLDELPQLFNVLGGDMSIVGPRPHALGTKAEGRLFWEAVDRYAARHRVRPGITGWAQVNGWRGETDSIEKIRNRVEHDLYYIENWSVWLDLWIIAKTAYALIRDKNAY